MPSNSKITLIWPNKQNIKELENIQIEPYEKLSIASQNSYSSTPTFDNLESNWENLFFLGDNKDILSYLLENGFQDKISLVYIDPPFNTGTDYGRMLKIPVNNEKNIQINRTIFKNQLMYYNNFDDKDFLQFIYERLQLIHQLLKPTGNIFIRIDYRFGHYIKILLDEIFGRDNFINEFVVNKSDRPTETLKRYHSSWDMLLFYGKSQKSYFNYVEIPRLERKWRGMHLYGERWTEIDPQFVHLFSPENLRESKGKIRSRARIILGKELLPPAGRHWALSQEDIFEYEQRNEIRLSKNGSPQTLERSSKKIDDVWTDIPGYENKNTGYPTENSEELLTRVIQTGSQENDIILDCFMGSATTQAVAQKLNRRWIGIDNNPSSIQIASNRLQEIIEDQISSQDSSHLYPIFASFKRLNENDKNFGLQSQANDTNLSANINLEKTTEHITIEITYFESQLLMNLIKEQSTSLELTKEIIDFNLLIDTILIDPSFDGNCFNRLIRVKRSHPLQMLETKFEFQHLHITESIAIKILDLLGNEFFSILSIKMDE